MPKKLVIPVFKSEAEDADWHDNHWKEIEDEFIRQIKAGTAVVVGKGEPPPKPLQAICIRLAESDIAVARELAARAGVGYQTYIRMVLREALRRKANRRS